MPNNLFNKYTVNGFGKYELHLSNKYLLQPLRLVNHQGNKYIYRDCTCCLTPYNTKITYILLGQHLEILVILHNMEYYVSVSCVICLHHKINYMI